MTMQLTAARAAVPARGAAGTSAARLLPWRLGLGAVLALSALLNGIGLWTLGYGNAYYAAAVQSMLTSWHNFFYVSFDSGGFVSIDKPPLGFWLQAASARLFGFHGVSLLLPEAIAGVVSVALLYHLVGRAWGRAAGLTAALLLAISPISVVAGRSNIVDGVLAMVLLLGAVAVTRAAESGRLRWLLLCAVLVGLGFNVKMLEAYLVVPAFGLVYLLSAPVAWRRRALHLAAASVVLLAVSLSWAVAVDLTPATQRPYVGSSTGDSEVNLALGYNGWGRVTGGWFRRPGAQPAATRGAAASPPVATSRGTAPPRGAGAGGFGIGEAGGASPLRLLRQPLGSQIGWLIPLAIAGLVAAAVRQRWRGPFDRRRRSLVLWGAWLLGEGAFFSVAGTVHAYYLTMLAPAVAALAGIGLAVMWGEVRRRTRWGWLLPVAVIATAAEAAWVLSGFPGWARWLTPLVLSSAAVAVALFAASRWRASGRRPLAALAVLAGGASLLAAPATWTVVTVTQASTAILPTAGPPPATPAQLRRAMPRGRQAAPFGQQADPSLLRYLEAHQGPSGYLVGGLAAMSVAPYMLAGDRPALALGGFMGGDRIVDPAQLAGMVAGGAVRFFLLPPPAAAGRGQFGLGGILAGGGVNGDLVAWVRSDCVPVAPGLWSAATARSGRPGQGQQLYDCAPPASARRPQAR
jgi:4-amino-4-deoxy-L-arabinose transferase-like glycosyltransferase